MKVGLNVSLPPLVNVWKVVGTPEGKDDSMGPRDPVPPGPIEVDNGGSNVKIEVPVTVTLGNGTDEVGNGLAVGTPVALPLGSYVYTG